MPNSRSALISFNAGEWTPKLDARVDLKKYAFACRQLENVLVEQYGAAQRRTGMEFVGGVATASNALPCRLVDFKFSETTSFALEFGDDYIRFFSNKAQVLLTETDVDLWVTTTVYAVGDYIKYPANTVYRCAIAHTAGVFATDVGAGKWVQTPIYEIVSPYSAFDVFGLHFQQINDVVYITHALYPTQKLTRISDISWTIEEVAFDTPPFLDENTEATTITPSATTGSVTLTASAATFLAGHVGSYWELTHDRPASSIEIAITGNGTSSTIPIRGTWEYRTTGTWTATFAIERSYDAGTTWERVVHQVGISENFANSDNVEAFEEALFRVKIENWSAGSGRAIISCSSSEVKGLAKVTAYTSATAVTATVIASFYSATATKAWREGAWSSVRGYPRTVTFFEQRLIFAGTSFEARSVWASTIGDYENFEYGSAEDSAFKFTLGSGRYDAIQWMLPHTRLLIGTAGDEWSCGDGSGGDALSAVNPKAFRQASRGSEGVQAVLANDSALFVQNGGKRIREMIYTFEKDGYATPDMSEYAEHITGTGKIVQLAFQQKPFPILWAVTSAGVLLSMTIEREQDILAWTSHPTDGTVRSVCVTPNVTTGNDDVWLIVQRGSVKNVEIMQTATWEDVADAVYVDSAYVFTDGPASSFAITRFANKTVSILADGAPLPDQVAGAGGEVTLDEDVTKCVIGLKYESIIKPMRLDVDPMVGPTQGLNRRVNELTVRFYRTVGCSFGDGEEVDSVNGGLKWRSLSFRDTSNDMDAPVPLFTGEKDIEGFGNWGREGTIILKQTQPLPWTVLAIIAKYDVSMK
jgi:hypothetical protein